jgi:hypothetical protein
MVAWAFTGNISGEATTPPRYLFLGAMRQSLHIRRSYREAATDNVALNSPHCSVLGAQMQAPTATGTRVRPCAEHLPARLGQCGLRLQPLSGHLTTSRLVKVKPVKRMPSA